MRGDRLPSELRRKVLASYIYRWTSDNPDRERAYRGIKGAPTIPLVSDDQWLREHSFWVTDRGTLDKRKKHAEPAYMSDEKGSSKAHATKKSPAQLQREIDSVLASPGSYSYGDAMEALDKKHEGAKRGGSLRSGHAPAVPKLARKTRWAPSHATKATAKDYRVMVRVEGAPKPVHVSPWMTHAQAEHAAKNHKAMVRDRGWTHVVEIEDRSGAITRLPRSHATMSNGFVPFDTWSDVLDAARRGDQLWYHAPLNIRPASVRVVKVFKNGSIRIDPMSRDADNFTADKGHLSRFRQRR